MGQCWLKSLCPSASCTTEAREALGEKWTSYYDNKCSAPSCVDECEHASSASTVPEVDDSSSPEPPADKQQVAAETDKTTAPSPPPPAPLETCAKKNELECVLDVPVFVISAEAVPAHSDVNSLASACDQKVSYVSAIDGRTDEALKWSDIPASTWETAPLTRSDAKRTSAMISRAEIATTLSHLKAAREALLYLKKTDGKHALILEHDADVSAAPFWQPGSIQNWIAKADLPSDWHVVQLGATSLQDEDTRSQKPRLSRTWARLALKSSKAKRTALKREEVAAASEDKKTLLWGAFAVLYSRAGLEALISELSLYTMDEALGAGPTPFVLNSMAIQNVADAIIYETLQQSWVAIPPLILHSSKQDQEHDQAGHGLGANWGSDASAKTAANENEQSRAFAQEVQRLAWCESVAWTNAAADGTSSVAIAVHDALIDAPHRRLGDAGNETLLNVTCGDDSYTMRPNSAGMPATGQTCMGAAQKCVTADDCSVGLTCPTRSPTFAQVETEKANNEGKTTDYFYYVLNRYNRKDNCRDASGALFEKMTADDMCCTLSVSRVMSPSVNAGLTDLDAARLGMAMAIQEGDGFCESDDECWPGLVCGDASDCTTKLDYVINDAYAGMIPLSVDNGPMLSALGEKSDGRCCKKCPLAVCPLTATAADDPHMNGFHGEYFDVKGINQTWGNMLSHKAISVASFFEDATYVSDGTPKKLVHGSYMTKSALVLQSNASEKLHVLYTPPNSVHVEVHSLPMADEAPPKLTATFHTGGEAHKFGDVLIKTEELKAGEIKMSVELKGQWHIEVTPRQYFHVDIGKQTGEEAATQPPIVKTTKRFAVDLSIKPISAKDIEHGPVAPHGILGQTLDGDDLAIEGNKDSYQGLVVQTSAQGEGAIEGTIKDYVLSSPFSTMFKYTRFGMSAAKARLMYRLTGKRNLKKGLSASTWA